MEPADIMSFPAMAAIENLHSLVVVLIFYVIEKLLVAKKSKFVTSMLLFTLLQRHAKWPTGTMPPPVSMSQKYPVRFFIYLFGDAKNSKS